MATIRAENLDQLAAKLGHPPSGLSAFRQLTPEQVGLLSDAIDEICAQRRRAMDEALAHAVPVLPRRVLLELLRVRPR